MKLYFWLIDLQWINDWKKVSASLLFSQLLEEFKNILFNGSDASQTAVSWDVKCLTQIDL
jgi:hypothetical protein